MMTTEQLREDLVGLLNSWVSSRTWGGGGIFDEEKDMNRIMNLISQYEKEKTEELVRKLEKLKKDLTYSGNASVDQSMKKYRDGVDKAIKIVKGEKE